MLKSVSRLSVVVSLQLLHAKGIAHTEDHIGWRSRNNLYGLLNDIGISQQLFRNDINYTTLTYDFMHQVRTKCKYNLIRDEQNKKILRYPKICVDDELTEMNGYTTTHICGYNEPELMSNVSLVRNAKLWNELSEIKCSNTLETYILEAIMRDYECNSKIMYSLYVSDEMYENTMRKFEKQDFKFLDRNNWYNIQTRIQPPPIAIEASIVVALEEV